MSEINKSARTMSSPRNKTITIAQDEYIVNDNNIIHGDLFQEIDSIENSSVSLLIADPPYNLNKKFGKSSFKKLDTSSYTDYTKDWISAIKPKLLSNASLYVFGDWRSSGCLFDVLCESFLVRNRITFEREKGRGSKSNFKNCSEDIFFATCSNDYTFNVDLIKLRRKVIAPYRDNGVPKDWQDCGDYKYRDTYPSNLWTDITIPFWSMSENTEHPTQKPEKLIAKLILASSNEGDLVFDPFLGSGTTAVVAKKLNRKYKGVEIDDNYCTLARKRLQMANVSKTIQGYKDGIFWERNGLHK